MKMLLAWMTTIFSVAAFAQSTPLKSDFQPYYEIKKDIRAKWQKQQDATFPIKFEKGLSCTAVFVGPSGQALTNLHCLESCLEDAGATKPTGPLMEVLPGAPVVCNAKYTKKLLPITAKVLKVLGPGWIKDRDQINQNFAEHPDFLIRLMHAGFESFGDLVLIQLPVESTCVRVGGSRAGEKILNIAYPILSRPTENPMQRLTTLGTTQLWSFGEMITSNEEIKARLGEDPVLKDFIPTIAIPGLTLSSVDSESGASGSPLFNEQGQLTAITRATVKGMRFEYVPWTTQGIHLLPLKEEIESSIPNVKACL